jgi:hypothetical protein
LVKRLAVPCRLTVSLARWRDEARVPEMLRGNVFAMEEIDLGGDELPAEESAKDGGAQDSKGKGGKGKSGSGRDSARPTPALTFQELERIPFARPVAGLLLASIAAGGYLSAYDVAEPAPGPASER